MGRAQAKRLRSNMTDAERRLWYRLRAHRFAGLKFKRQAPIGSYIVDFICFDRIELDGGQHAENAKDARRDAWLANEGYRVMRFWNDDVLKRTNAVLELIAQTLSAPEVTPLPARFARHPLPPNSGLPEFGTLSGRSRKHPTSTGERGQCGTAEQN